MATARQPRDPPAALDAELAGSTPSSSPRPDGAAVARLGRGLAQARARSRSSSLLWQIVVWSGGSPSYVLPGPVTVFQTLFDNLGDYSAAAVDHARSGRSSASASRS